MKVLHTSATIKAPKSTAAQRLRYAKGSVFVVSRRSISGYYKNTIAVVRRTDGCRWYAADSPKGKIKKAFRLVRHHNCSEEIYL